MVSHPVQRISFVFMFIICLIPLHLLAQDEPGLEANGAIVDTKGQKLGGVTVTLTEMAAGTKPETAVTGKNGRFSCFLEFNKEYTLSFSKKGFITKKILIDTYLKNGGKSFYQYDYTVILPDHIVEKDLGAELLDKPVVKVFYNPQIKDFAFDSLYRVRIEQEIASISPREKEALIQKLETQVNINNVIKPREKDPREKEMEEKYNTLVNKGDQAFANKDYAAARAYYKEAIEIKSLAQYPNNKLIELNAAVEAENAEKFRDQIDKADKAMAEKNYKAAKEYYVEAIFIKPDDKYPKDKIEEITNLLAAEDQKKLTDEKYEQAINRGDKAFKDKYYNTAKSAYFSAHLAKPNEKYPKNRIAEITRLLEKQASQKVIDDKFNKTIVKADLAFASAEYIAARSAYEEALGIKPQEKYPQNKLAEIDDLLTQREDPELIQIISKPSARANGINQSISDIQQTQKEKANEQRKRKDDEKNKMNNMLTKYETKNPLTSLYDVIDEHDKGLKQHTEMK